MRRYFSATIIILLFAATVAGQEKFNREALVAQPQREEIRIPRIVIVPPFTIIENIPIFHFDYKMSLTFDVTTPFHIAEPFVTLALPYLITKDKKSSRIFAYTYAGTSEFVDGINSDQGWDWGDVIARTIGFIIVEKYIIE